MGWVRRFSKAKNIAMEKRVAPGTEVADPVRFQQSRIPTTTPPTADPLHGNFQPSQGFPN